MRLEILDVGAATHQGSRPYQEDRYTCLLPEDFPAATENELAFFAVYDGHGNGNIADRASKTLHLNLASCTELQAGDYERAIQDAVRSEEEQLYEEFVGKSTDAPTSGSTMALALVDLTDSEMVVGDLGDSSIVLGEQQMDKSPARYKVKRLTKAHDPTDVEEKARVEDMGGEVQYHGGSARIGSVNMSRALGDFQYKQPLDQASGDFISSQPHIIRHRINHNKLNVLVLGTDGVFNCMEDQVLFDYIGDQLQQGWSVSKISEGVVRSCTEGKQFADNTTCIIVILNRARYLSVGSGGRRSSSSGASPDIRSFSAACAGGA